MDVYREYLDPQTGKATQFCMIGKDGTEEACFLEPYPMPGTLQQKRSIARAIGTTYIYDFLGLIEKAMVLEWRQFIAGPGMGDVPGKPYTLYPIPYTLYPIPYTLYPLLPYILYPIPCTLYPKPYTLYPIPYSIYHIPYTLYPIPYILCPKPYILYPIP